MSDYINFSTFFGTLIVCWCLIKLNSFLSKRGFKNLRKTKQTFHIKSTSRLGGIAILIPLTISLLNLGLDLSNSFIMIAVACSILAFISGLMDDLNFNNSPIVRLIFLLPVPILFFYLTDLKVLGLDIPYVDLLFQYEIFTLLFMTFAIIGMINAFNIIDGFNGLFATYCLTIIFSLSFKEIILGENFIYLNDYPQLLSALLGSLLGFLIFNIFGKIFMGDAGAYFLGALLCWIVIHQNTMSNSSPWSTMLIFIYPFTEVLVSIIRKVIFRKMSPMDPDGLHFHMLIYKRITKRIGFRRVRLRHLFTTAIIISLNLPFLTIATVAHKNSAVLAASSFSYIFLYTLIYFFLLPKKVFRGTN